jgi:hypothetical protein
VLLDEIGLTTFLVLPWTWRRVEIDISNVLRMKPLYERW